MVGQSAKSVRRTFLSLVTALLLLAVGGTIFSFWPPVQAGISCKRVANKPLCYTDLINTVLKTRGLSAAFDVLAAAYDADTSFASTCHAVTHDLGKAAYEKFHRTGKFDLTNKVAYCGFGFYHGFIDALLVETKDYAEARAFCRAAGEEFPYPIGVAERNCYHGIGHGITDGNDPRLWGSAVEIAAPGLVLCDQVATSTLLRGHCYSGVFNGLAAVMTERKFKLDVGGDPYALCETHTYTSLMKERCYTQFNAHVYSFANSNFTKALAVGMSVANPEYRLVAIHSVARFAVHDIDLHTSDEAARRISSACNSLAAPYRFECIAGIIQGVFTYGTPNEEQSDAVRLCNSESLDRSLRRDCFGELLKTVALLYPPALIGPLCDQTPAQYRTTYCSPQKQ